MVGLIYSPVSLAALCGSRVPRSESLLGLLDVTLHSFWQWLLVKPNSAVVSSWENGVLAVIAEWETANELPGFLTVVSRRFTTRAAPLFMFFTDAVANSIRLALPNP